MNHLTDKQIQNYLDNTYTEKTVQIDNHIKSCEYCRKNLQNYEHLIDLIHKQKIPELSDQFMQSTLNNLNYNKDKRINWLENIVVFVMIVVSIILCFNYIDVLKYVSYFSSINFGVLLRFAKSIVSFIAPNSVFIVSALLITILIEFLDRFKTQQSIK